MPDEKTVFLTGATGFVGQHVASALLENGYHVKCLIRPTQPDQRTSLDTRLPESLRGRVEPVAGDVLEAGHLVDQLRDCVSLMHVAAFYSFSPSQRHAVWETNVRGTSSLLEAARLAGIEKTVVTSSSATVGPARGLRLATEEDSASNHDGSTYHRSKIEQERRALAAQIPTVLVLPSAPVGPGDAKPTPTGRMVVDFMKGRLFATLPGGLNVVPVEDVARAHVAALEHGVAGERYLVGGANLTLRQLFGMLATICGRPAPRWEIPYSVAYALGLLDEWRCRFQPESDPVVPLEGVRMGREYMFISSRKAESQLDFRAGSVLDALRRSVEWYRSHGYA